MSDQSGEQSSVQKLLEITARIEERQRIASIDSLYLLVLPLTISLAGVTVTVITKLIPAIEPFFWFSLSALVGVTLIPFVRYCQGIYSESVEIRLRAVDHTILMAAMFPAALIGLGVLFFIQKIFSLILSSQLLFFVGVYCGSYGIARWINAHFTEKYVVGAFVKRTLFPSKLNNLVEQYKKRKKNSRNEIYWAVSFYLAGVATILTNDFFWGILVLGGGVLVLSALMVFIFEKILAKYLYIR